MATHAGLASSSVTKAAYANATPMYARAPGVMASSLGLVYWKRGCDAPIPTARPVSPNALNAAASGAPKASVGLRSRTLPAVRPRPNPSASMGGSAKRNLASTRSRLRSGCVCTSQ